MFACAPELRRIPNANEEESRAGCFICQRPPTFRPDICKIQLQTAMGHVGHLAHRRRQALVRRREEIVDALQRGQEATAMLRVETLLRDEAFLEGLSLLQEVAHLFLSDLDEVAIFKQCPPHLKETVCSLIYGALMCRHEIVQFEGVITQLTRKYGEPFITKVAARVPGVPIKSLLKGTLAMHMNELPFERRYARLREIANEAGIILEEGAVLRD